MQVERLHEPAGDRLAPSPPIRARVRQAWMDNLRVVVIIGVIGAHVATAYILDVGWYYEELTANPVSEALVGLIVMPGLLFGMGALFLVAGLLTPRALVRKGAARFALDRLMRLGLALAVFVVLIDPLTDFAGYRAEGGQEGFIGHFGEWRREDADMGPGWFIAALLAFSLAYAAWRSLRPASPDRGGRLDGRRLVTVGLFIGVGSFAVRLVWPFLSTSTLYGLNLWEFPQMVALFALGVVAAERGWLSQPLPDRLWHRCGWAALAGMFLLLVTLVGIELGGDWDPFLGGLRPQALLIPSLEAVIAVGMSLWTLEWFRRRWNHAGRSAHALGRASFAAYIVHAPVVVGLSAALRSAPVPVEVKFLVVLSVGVVASFGLGWLITRSRLIGRIV